MKLTLKFWVLTLETLNLHDLNLKYNHYSYISYL